MLISVVIPTVRNINSLIKKIKLHSYQDVIEYIVVNDSDEKFNYNSEELKNKFNIKIINSEYPFSGPGSSRNIGILIASGQYFLFMDDDDDISFEDDFLECINKFNHDMIIGNFNHPNKSYERKLSQKLLSIGIDEYLSKLNKKNIFLNHCLGILFSRNLFFKNKIFFPPTKIAEDLVFCSNVLMYVKSITISSKFSYAYTMNVESSKNQISTNLIYDLYINKEFINSNVLGNKKIYQLRVKNFINRIIYSRSPIMIKNSFLFKFYKKTNFDFFLIFSIYMQILILKIRLFIKLVELYVFIKIKDPVVILYCAGAISETWLKFFYSKITKYIYIVDDNIVSDEVVNFKGMLDVISRNLRKAKSNYLFHIANLDKNTELAIKFKIENEIRSCFGSKAKVVFFA